MAAVVALVAAWLVSASGDDAPASEETTAPAPRVRPTQSINTSAAPCPKELPRDEMGEGFETFDPAREAPSLLTPEDAWVCGYSSLDPDRDVEDTGEAAWKHVGEVQHVRAADLPKLRDAFTELRPTERDRVCTLDLGPRWLIVYRHGRVRAGVVIDDYGCRDARLIDEARLVDPRGEADPRTVEGTLDGGRAILAALAVGRGAG